VLYAGDSIAAETRDMVAFWTQASGKAQLFDSIFPGLAICDFLEDKPAGMPAAQKLRAKVRAVRPHLVILQFWGNALTPCMSGFTAGTEAYYNQYFWDALNAVNQITAGAADAGIPRPKILWVLQGPDSGNRDRVRRLNETYAFAASNSGDRTSDAGFDVSMAAYPFDNAVKDRLAWTQFLPCTQFERDAGWCTSPAFGGVAQLHKDQDPVHFCLGTVTNIFTCDRTSPGISRYGMHIAHDATVWLGI
jgi:hypothetical protein